MLPYIHTGELIIVDFLRAFSVLTVCAKTEKTKTLIFAVWVVT